MSAASWIRVANGFRLVASSASSLILKEGTSGAASLTRHGVDLAKNARTAVQAAGVSRPLQLPVKVDINTHAVNESNNMAVKDDEAYIAGTRLEQVIATQTDILKSVESNTIAKSEERKIGQEEIEETAEQQPTIDTNPSLLKEGTAVPSTRIGRAVGFASLGLGIAAGTVVEAASRLVSLGSNSDSIVANDANADRLAKTLCRMRGAAMKLGQMLSIQDETLLPPQLSRALEQVRQGADAMPLHQLHQQLEKELGKGWREKFETFEDLPFAAASIGQVHRATIVEHGETKNVVVKVQYPGVADSIESDLKNLAMLVKLSGFAPKGLFIDRVIDVGRDELKVECDYEREAQNQERLQDLVHGCPDLAREKFRVPSVISSHSTRGILTTDYCPGGSIDKVAFLDQEERNRIGRNIMRLTVKELFTWRFMQTDPNVRTTHCFSTPVSVLYFYTNSHLIYFVRYNSGETSCTTLALLLPILLTLDLHANIANHLWTGTFGLYGLVRMMTLIHLWRNRFKWDS